MVPVFLGLPLADFSFPPDDAFERLFPGATKPSDEDRNDLLAEVADYTAGYFRQEGYSPQPLSILLAVLIDYLLVTEQTEHTTLLFIAAGLLSKIHEEALETQLRNQ
jgi:hypothetical protein